MNASLRELAWVVARDVNRTVGGGIAAIELLRRSFDGRGWVDASTHGLLVAVSRLTPGTNILAYCAAAGWRLHGWRGMLTALVAASLPGSLLIYALAATLVRLDRYLVVRMALSVGTLIAAALVFASAWALLKPYVRSTRRASAFVIVGIAAALAIVGWTPVRVLLVCAIVGALLPVTRSRAGSADVPRDHNREPRPPSGPDPQPHRSSDPPPPAEAV